MLSAGTARTDDRQPLRLPVWRACFRYKDGILLPEVKFFWYSVVGIFSGICYTVSIMALLSLHGHGVCLSILF